MGSPVIGLEVKITLLLEKILGLPEMEVYALVEPSLCLDLRQRDDTQYNDVARSINDARSGCADYDYSIRMSTNDFR